MRKCVQTLNLQTRLKEKKMLIMICLTTFSASSGREQLARDPGRLRKFCRLPRHPGAALQQQQRPRGRKLRVRP